MAKFDDIQLKLQGDLSGCVMGFVDIKTKVAFQDKSYKLKHNLCFEVTITHDTT